MSQSFDERRSWSHRKHMRKHAANARVIRCTFSALSRVSLYSVGLASRWAMLDGMRNTSEAVRHSYLNQHNSGDEWLTGFGGEGKEGWEEEKERVDGGNALHLWKLLRPNFSVKCMIYGRVYYLRSCPLTIQCTSHHIQHPSLSLSLAADLPPRKLLCIRSAVNEKFTAECPFADTAAVINAFLIVIRNTLEFMAR